MTRHVGGTALARYREGDFGSRKSARIRAHLAACARCAAMDTDLAGLTALLARAPAPAMPDQVTTRIQAALMAEAASAAPAGDRVRQGTSRQPAEPVRPRRSRHAAGRAARGQRWRLPELRPQLGTRALGAAAAAAAIAGGIYGVVQLAPTGQSALNTSAGGSAASESRAPASFTPVSTGTNFQHERLASQVRSLLLRSGRELAPNQGTNVTGRPKAQPGPVRTGTLSLGGISATALHGCVMRISAGSKVLLVDVDRYQDRRATVIVLAGPGGGTSGARVFVVGPGCSGTDSDLIARESLPGGG